MNNILSELVLKEKKWLRMAYGLSGDYNLSKDLVQDMYLKVFDIKEGLPNKEIKDAYIWGVLRSNFIDTVRKTKDFKFTPLHYANDLKSIDKQNEFDDEDLELLEKSKELRYIYRYYLESNYDKSIREIASENKVSSFKIFSDLKKAREHILGDNIHKYINKRNKHK